MKRDPCNSSVCSDSRCIQEGQVIIIDTGAHLDCHGDTKGLGTLHRRCNDLFKEKSLVWQGRTATFTRHLRNWAAKIEIDVVSAILSPQHLNRLGQRCTFRRIELNGTGRLVLSRDDHPHRLLIAFYKSACGDHLGDEEPCALLSTEGAESRVGDSSHGSEYDGRIDRHLPIRKVTVLDAKRERWN